MTAPVLAISYELGVEINENLTFYTQFQQPYYWPIMADIFYLIIGIFSTILSSQLLGE